jgi:hypothetical protein
MKEIKDLDFRMYCLVLYNISPIQQGIQSLHAALEYANEYSNIKLIITKSKKIIQKNTMIG